MNCIKVVACVIFAGACIITGCASADVTQQGYQNLTSENAYSQPTNASITQDIVECAHFMTVQAEEPATDSSEKPKEPQTAPSTKKIISNAYFNIGLYDPDKIKAKIIESAIAKGGYMQQEGNLNLVIHVPANQFQSIADEISNYGRIIDKNIYSRDVSETYIDLTTQAKVKNESLNPLREMLKKTETKEDMLSVLKEIRALQDEIDVVEGQRRFIQVRVDKSVIEMNFRLEQQMVAAPSKIKLPIDWLYRHSLEFLMDIR